MKINKKIICILLILLIGCIIVIPQYSMAFDMTGLGSLDAYKGDEGVSTEFDARINKIIYLIQTVGSILSVVTLVIIGIRYMICSVEERADFKKAMIPYIIGAVMVFGISNITGFIYYLANNIF